MGYGFTMDDVKNNHSSPQNKYLRKEYSLVNCISEPEFSLKEIFIKKDNFMNLDFKSSPSGTLYLDNGNLDLFIDDKNKKFKINMEEGESSSLLGRYTYNLKVKKDSLVYLFSHKDGLSDLIPISKVEGFEKYVDLKKDNCLKTFDKRKKYWGSIETIVSNEFYAGKKLIISQRDDKRMGGSLEYHIKKKEAYFLQKGKLETQLRIGRAKNISVIMGPGEVFIINRGLMHGRRALEDSVIIEISTKDDDKDSNLVEDGKTYIHNSIS